MRIFVFRTDWRRIAACAFLLLATRLGAVPGDEHWDRHFGFPGTSNTVYALTLDGNRIYAGGLYANPVISTNIFIEVWDGSQWQREVGIVAPDITREGQAAHSTWGQSMSFSREAGWFAFGDPANVTAGAGVSHELIGEGPRHGAAYLFKRVETAGGHWNFLSLIKAPHPGAEDGFGETVAISGSGRTLAVGAVFEDSNARGVDGNQLDNSSPESGAAYLY